MMRIPHYLDNWVRDGGKFDIFKHQPFSFSQERFFISLSVTDFFSKASKDQDLVRPEGLGKLINFSYLLGFRTHDLPHCRIVPQPLCYRVHIRMLVMRI
jgi:hypothetical protein